MKVKIQGKEYELHYSLGGHFVYESVFKEPYKGDTMMSTYMLFWAMLAYCNREEFSMSHTDFIDAMTEEPQPFLDFCDLMTAYYAKFEKAVDQNNKKKVAKTKT